LLKPDEDVRWHAAGSYIRLCSPELPTSKACSARLSCENVPQHTYAPGLPALEPAMASLRPSPEPRCAWPSIHSENPGSAGWKCKEPAAWLGAELKILGGWQSADVLPIMSRRWWVDSSRGWGEPTICGSAAQFASRKSRTPRNGCLSIDPLSSYKS
jgi:hypothetical protein